MKETVVLSFPCRNLNVPKSSGGKSPKGLPFREKFMAWKMGKDLSPRIRILPFHPFLDQQGLLRVSGQLQKAEVQFSECHSLLLLGSHRITELMITTEHLWLLHAGPTLVSTSLSR